MELYNYLQLGCFKIPLELNSVDVRQSALNSVQSLVYIVQFTNNIAQ